MIKIILDGPKKEFEVLFSLILDRLDKSLKIVGNNNILIQGNNNIIGDENNINIEYLKRLGGNISSVVKITEDIEF